MLFPSALPNASVALFELLDAFLKHGQISRVSCLIVVCEPFAVRLLHQPHTGIGKIIGAKTEIISDVFNAVYKPSRCQASLLQEPDEMEEAGYHLLPRLCFVFDCSVPPDLIDDVLIARNNLLRPLFRPLAAHAWRARQGIRPMHTGGRDPFMSTPSLASQSARLDVASFHINDFVLDAVEIVGKYSICLLVYVSER